MNSGTSAAAAPVFADYLLYHHMNSGTEALTLASTAEALTLESAAEASEIASAAEASEIAFAASERATLQKDFGEGLIQIWMDPMCHFFDHPPLTMLLEKGAYVDVDVNVDVMMSGLVPFLLCPFLQGPYVGALRSEANFLRWMPSTWRTGTNTLISPGSRKPYWRSSCHSFKRALARAPSGVTWLLPSRCTHGVKPSDEGLPPICRPYEFPPVPAPRQSFMSGPKHLASGHPY